MNAFFIFLLSLALVSCGGTTVKVKQSSDGVNATVSVQTNNPTDVNVNPSVSVKLDDVSELLNSVQDSLSFDENGEMIISSDTIKKILRTRDVSDLVNFVDHPLYSDELRTISLPHNYLLNLKNIRSYGSEHLPRCFRSC